MKILSSIFLFALLASSAGAQMTDRVERVRAYCILKGVTNCAPSAIPFALHDDKPSLWQLRIPHPTERELLAITNAPEIVAAATASYWNNMPDLKAEDAQAIRKTVQAINAANPPSNRISVIEWRRATGK